MITFQVKIFGNNEVMIHKVNWSNIPRRGDLIDVGNYVRLRVVEVHFDLPDGDVFISLESVSDLNVTSLLKAGFSFIGDDR